MRPPYLSNTSNTLAAAAAAKSLQSWLILCNPIDSSPQGSPVSGILQARTLEWVAISFSSAWKWKREVTQSCLTLSDPMDCSLPGSSVHGIFQARVLEWAAIAFSANMLEHIINEKKEGKNVLSKAEIYLVNKVCFQFSKWFIPLK